MEIQIDERWGEGEGGYDENCDDGFVDPSVLFKEMAHNDAEAEGRYEERYGDDLDVLFGSRTSGVDER